MASENNSIVVSVPAPIGGWNERDPLDSMPLTDAPILDNFFPNPSKVSLRRGSRLQSSGVGTFVETLASYSYGTTRVLLAAAGGAIYSCNTIGAAGVSLASGFTNNSWQTVSFNGKMIWVNGTDQPQQFDGTTFSAAVYTGTGLTDDANFINVAVYKNRLYFVEKNTLNVWYAASEAITGAVTKFPLASEFERGGSLLYAGPWNSYASGQQSNTFVAISSLGEVVAYAGSYPGETTGASAWGKIGHYAISVPIGYRSFFPYLSDQICMLMEGAIPLSLTASPDAQSAASGRINDKIAVRWNELIREFLTTPGWCGVYHARSNMFLFNLPTGGNTFEQHVQNVLSGAWCRFLFKNARSWVVHNNNLYFGNSSGEVIEADTGQDDRLQPIPATIQLAFNDLQAPDREKRLLMVEPYITCTHAVDVTMDVDLDLRMTTSPLQVAIATGGTPWMSPWMSAWSGSGEVIKHWRAIYGVGTKASLKGAYAFQNTELDFSAFKIMYEAGGVL